MKTSVILDVYLMGSIVIIIGCFCAITAQSIVDFYKNLVIKVVLGKVSVYECQVGKHAEPYIHQPG